jgi:chromosome segregation ATPase
MTLSFQMIAAGVAVIVFSVIGILLLMPAEKARQARRRKDEQIKADPAKDWEANSLHLERHIQALRRDIETYQKTERTLTRDLEVQKEKYHKLQEKLTQERDWKKREDDELEKKTREIATLKTSLRTTEDDLNATHSERLRFERELREVKGELESVIAARRNFELQVQKLEAETESQRKQIKDLKWESSQLSNKLADKKEAESWVPKDEFEKLQVELRHKDKELARLKEQFKKELL